MSHLNPLIIFSGDALSPSLLSTITHGEHMVPILNAIGVHVAAVGNHDFDYGKENLEKLMPQFNFPWLMANVLDVKTGGGQQQGYFCGGIRTKTGKCTYNGTFE
jgi:5'-nucleotidase